MRVRVRLRLNEQRRTPESIGRNVAHGSPIARVKRRCATESKTETAQYEKVDTKRATGRDRGQPLFSPTGAQAVVGRSSLHKQGQVGAAVAECTRSGCVCVRTNFWLDFNDDAGGADPSTHPGPPGEPVGAAFVPAAGLSCDLTQAGGWIARANPHTTTRGTQRVCSRNGT